MRALSAQGLQGDALRDQAYRTYMEAECPNELEECKKEISALHKKTEVTWKGWKATMTDLLKDVSFGKHDRRKD